MTLRKCTTWPPVLGVKTFLWLSMTPWGKFQNMIQETLHSLAPITLQPHFAHLFTSAVDGSLFMTPVHRTLAHSRSFAWNILSFALNLINILQTIAQVSTCQGDRGGKRMGWLWDLGREGQARLREQDELPCHHYFNQDYRSLISISQSSLQVHLSLYDP